MLTPLQDSRPDMALHSCLSSNLIVHRVILVKLRGLAIVPIACSKYVFT